MQRGINNKHYKHYQLGHVDRHTKLYLLYMLYKTTEAYSHRQNSRDDAYNSEQGAQNDGPTDSK